jgi:predicted ATP-dependent endonuclease of OLD family
LLIVTHSPLFISMDNISDLILLRELRGESVAIQLPQDYFAKNEALRLERIVRSEDKEFFFSRGVILVEGETESGAVPVFSNKLGKSLDKEGISVVCVGGNYFGMFVKLLIGFHFPYLVLCDRDVGNRISHTIPIGSSTCATSSLFHQLHQLSLLDSEDMAKLREFEGNITEKSENGKSLKEYNEAVFQQIREIAIKHRVFVLTSDFEGILSNAGYDGLLKESRKHFSRSKVLQGRFVAEEAESVPKEIGEAIDLLYDQLAMKKHS